MEILSATPLIPLEVRWIKTNQERCEDQHCQHLKIFHYCAYDPELDEDIVECLVDGCMGHFS